MPKTGTYFHEILNVDDVPVTTSFNAANKHDIFLNASNLGSPVGAQGKPFFGKLEGMVIRVKALAGAPAPTKITIKITHNPGGQQVIIPDTEGTIGLEVGSTTIGGCAYRFDFPYVHNDDQLHIFYKADNGTCTVDAVELYWSE
jgi:hypothetical protein